MNDYQWPDPATRPLLGKRISRVDGPVKVSGRAKYTYDYNPDGLLAGMVLRCPYAHARITSIDTSAAEKMPGVKAVRIIQPAGTEIFWAGDEVVGVAAVDEPTAEDAIRAIKVQYEVLPHFVSDAEPPKNIALDTGPLSQDDFEDLEDNQVPDEQVIATIRKNGISFKPSDKYLKSMQESGTSASVVQALRKAKYVEGTTSRSPYKKTAVQKQGDPDKAFDSAATVSEGLYGASCITHCCLETHGMASEWPGEKDLVVHISTQNVSGMAPQLAEPLGIPAGNIQVLQQYVGGGFGSKLGPDRWGIDHRAPFQVCWRQAGEDHARTRCRAGSRRHASVRICARENRRRQRRKVCRMGIELLGNRRNGRWRHASVAVYLRHSQSTQTERRHRH